MVKVIKNNVARPIQLELFSSTQQLNLSEIYEAIPKEISKNDPDIIWETKNIALPIEKSFSLENQTMITQIKPATIFDKLSKNFVTKFPHFRESRVEYAILTIASKDWLQVQYDDKTNGKPSYYTVTSIYRIQKEIVQAMNKVDGTNLKPNDCPYNTRDIREALNILKETNYIVSDSITRKKEYSFNRIKDLGYAVDARAY